MRPTDAIHDELIEFLCSTFEESLVIFAEVMCLLLTLTIPLPATSSSFDIVPIAILHVLVKCCENSDNTFKQKQFVIEAMYFELREESSP